MHEAVLLFYVVANVNIEIGIDSLICWKYGTQGFVTNVSKDAEYLHM